MKSHAYNLARLLHCYKGCKNCAMFVNDQHLTVNQYCDKVACSERSYPEFKFITFH